MIHHKICSAILLCNKFTEAACTEYFKVKMMMMMMMMMMTTTTMMMEIARTFLSICKLCKKKKNTKRTPCFLFFTGK